MQYNIQKSNTIESNCHNQEGKDQGLIASFQTPKDFYQERRLKQQLLAINY